MTNLRVIRVSFRAAVESHGNQRDAPAERARLLLREARSQATTQEVLDETLLLEAEVEAAMEDGARHEHR